MKNIKTMARMTSKKLNKKNRSILVLSPLLVSALALGACSSQQQVEKNAVDDGAVTPEQENVEAGTVGAGGASGVTSNSTKGDYLPNKQVNNDPNDTSDLSLAGLKDPNNLLSQRIIYFDYNQSAIRPEYMVLINTHAKLAAKFPELKMRLEGHADERGSREYNVALSEQRAQSVRSIMGTQGARSSQIKTIGYGEEIPVVTGHNQKSWQKNRRVEIKYDNY